MHQCSLCPSVFDTEMGVIMHQRRKHSAKVQNPATGKSRKHADSPCPLCAHVASSRNLLGRHLRNIHQKNLRDFPDNSLSAGVFRRTYGQEKPQQSLTPVIPDASPTTEAISSPQSNEVAVDHPVRGRWICPICSKDYAARCTLSTHLRDLHQTQLTLKRVPRKGGPRKAYRPKGGWNNPNKAVNGIGIGIATVNKSVSAEDLLDTWKQKRQALRDTLAQIDEMIQISERIVYQ